MTEQDKIQRVTEAAKVCFMVTGAGVMGIAYMSRDIERVVRRQVGSRNFVQLLEWSDPFIKLNVEAPSGRPQQCLREGVVKFLSCLFSPWDETGCKRAGREDFSKLATTLNVCRYVAGDVKNVMA